MERSRSSTKRSDSRHAEARGSFYMISVAAERAGMHPQTLRIYEMRGLITPRRSPRGTRLYSDADVERLRRIQELTSEFGMGLTGVAYVLALQERLARAEALLARRADK